MLTFGLLIMQPKFSGKIIDIVSGDTETPEQKAEGLRAVNSTILEIFLVVIVGYMASGVILGFFILLLYNSKRLTSSGCFPDRQPA